VHALYGKRMRHPALAAFALPCTLWLCACDPNLTFEAKAGCGEATPAEASHGALMLPGRECKSCHRGFTAAGTVFDSLSAACNTGVAEATVEILDMDGNAALTLTTNAAGNFYTKARLPSPFRARVRGPDGAMQEMQGSTSDGNCSRCHRQPPVEKAPGRLALQLSAPDAGSPAAAGSGG
jgi:hypothetical protein